MARFFFDEDARIDDLKGKTIAVFGYGNQGRSQALNLRDSGLAVIVANRDDYAKDDALADQFQVFDFGTAAAKADVIMLLLPDEVQQSVYTAHVERYLTIPKTLCFAHGFNIRFGRISPPDPTDVILVAPRMIGIAVRELFLQGSGVPAFLAVEKDASGRAMRSALAIAKGLGATRIGALETTFAEETELDLFSEQVVWPVILRLFSDCFEFLADQGYSPEAALMELYASGEPSRVLDKAASIGLFRQAALHSRTSQYGTASRMHRLPPSMFENLAARALAEIRGGSFAEEWADEQQAGFPRFDALREDISRLPVNAGEDRFRALLQKPPYSDESH